MKLLVSMLFMVSSGILLGQSLNYDEAIDGDLSNDYTDPTELVVAAGDNFLRGTLTGGTQDLDLFRLVVPADLEVTGIILVEADGGGAGSFFLLQPGDQLSAPPSNEFNTGVNPIGFSILSPAAMAEGSDILPTILLPGIPSLPPFFGQETLDEGNYAGWLNETGAPSEYVLNFQTRAVAVPEPSVGLLFLPAIALLVGQRRRSGS